MIFLGIFFFFNDTATTEIYTLSLHDALPISGQRLRRRLDAAIVERGRSRRAPRRFHDSNHATPHRRGRRPVGDRKSTRLNSSHQIISYAVFCLKKKKKNKEDKKRQES